MDKETQIFQLEGLNASILGIIDNIKSGYYEEEEIKDLESVDGALEGLKEDINFIQANL